MTAPLSDGTEMYHDEPVLIREALDIADEIADGRFDLEALK